MTWQWSVPNLILVGLLALLLYYKLHLLRLTVRDTIRAEIEALKKAAPGMAIGERFAEQRFEEIRQDLRELTARVEHVETMLGENGRVPSG